MLVSCLFHDTLFWGHPNGLTLGDAAHVALIVSIGVGALYDPLYLQRKALSSNSRCQDTSTLRKELTRHLDQVELRPVVDHLAQRA